MKKSIFKEILPVMLGHDWHLEAVYLMNSVYTL